MGAPCREIPLYNTETIGIDQSKSKGGVKGKRKCQPDQGDSAFQ